MFAVLEFSEGRERRWVEERKKIGIRGLGENWENYGKIEEGGGDC